MRLELVVVSFLLPGQPSVSFVHLSHIGCERMQYVEKLLTTKMLSEQLSACFQKYYNQQ